MFITFFHTKRNNPVIHQLSFDGYIQQTSELTDFLYLNDKQTHTLENSLYGTKTSIIQDNLLTK